MNWWSYVILIVAVHILYKSIFRHTVVAKNRKKI